ncbi:MAG: FHA domain-containing protein [Anaerolineae bacterium]
MQPSIATKKYNDADYEEGTPRWGSARFNGAVNLVLDILETKRSFVFDYDEITQIVIGRKDSDDLKHPLVDLTSVGGLEKGVSRRHAKIVRNAGALHIVDNGSANGTYLNGQRLVEEQPRVLRDGDDIRLGHLTVRVTFRPVVEQS